MRHEDHDLRKRNLAGTESGAEPAPAVVDFRGNGSVTKSSAGPILRVENLTVGFGAAAVLREVSLSFPGGSITALVGPTGRGNQHFCAP
jgi:ABC-type multidrug transport system fused ATPase/permease subunit